MSPTRRGKEISVRLSDDLGSGATLFDRLKDAGIDVVASCCYQIGGEAYFTIVADQPERALAVLKEHKLTVEQQDVLLVEMPNTAGSFAGVLQQIAALGVDVRSAYATTTAGPVAVAVLKTADDDRVIEQIED